MQNNKPVAVITHNPNGKWGDVRPLIEKQGYYQNWNKSINLELGKQVLLYISNNVRQIQYLLEVTRVDNSTMDLRLIKKLTSEQMELLSYEKLKEHGIKQGTINYSLQNDTQLSKYILNVLNNSTLDIKRDISLSIKNIILYGSPGVGKTHNTNKLIRLIESGVPEKEIFETIKSNKENNGVDIDNIKDRVKFITFHQSFGYEDFIEGFRPNEEGKINLVDGVFKEISNNARNSKFSLTLNIEDMSENPNVWKVSLGEGGEIKEKCFENDCIRLGWDNYGDLDKLEFIKQRELRDFYNLEIGDIVFAFKNQWEIDGIGIIVGNYKFKDGYEQYKHQRKIKWLIKDKSINIKTYNENIRLTLSTLYRLKRIAKSDVLEILDNEQNRGISKKIEEKNYYLIIDEINRGNISKIFGELITLIEEDKRDTLEVTLPYSKKPFKIPSNLYIIGTMNSTDKSIALIDIALRRRFTFLKMEPNLDLVTNAKAKNIMRQLNEKITETLGADYVLGHSYFMKIENDDALDFVLEYKIRPLLEEYFYGDEQGLKSVMKIVRYDGDGDTE